MVNDIPDFCGILEECKAILERCPKPEYDCIVMTEAVLSRLKWYCHLESGALTPNPIAGDLGKLDLYGLKVFATDTPETAQLLAEKLRDEGRRPLLVAEGRPEDYGPSPMAEQLKAKGLSIASVETVAKQIVQGIDAGQRVVYTPKRWRLIMMFARIVPFWIWKWVRV